MFTLNSAKTELAFEITVDVAQLTGAISAAHIHNAPPGVGGGVVRDLNFVNGTASGTWTSGDTQALTAAMVSELQDGNLYVNIHTAVNGGGEIRGQIVSYDIGTTPFSASLDSAQAGTTVPAMGTGVFTLNSAETELAYHITVDVAQLTGAITQAHIHNAPAGQGGGVVRNLSFVNGTASGNWTSGDGQALTPTILNELKNSNLYVNIHTAVNGGGEIRGQIIVHSGFGATPVIPSLSLIGTVAMAGLLTLVYLSALRRRRSTLSPR